MRIILNGTVATQKKGTDSKQKKKSQSKGGKKSKQGRNKPEDIEEEDDMATGGDITLRDISHPSLNEALKAHNSVTFKLVRTGE
ncbi:hypothetical protein C0J52_13166 [Blattella germanica]|nr:hypothetical protein C0J52_13166 [Blattella germanica]